MSKNVNLAKSDISSLFEQLENVSREAKQEEKKRRDYVETSTSDISNLFEGLEEASRQAKELSSKETDKLDAFSGLMEQMTTITKKVEDDVTTQINEVVTEFVDEDITHEEEDELREFVEEQETKEPEQPTEKSATIIEKIVDNLDEMRYNTEVKEELDQIETLRKEFEQYKTALQNQVTKSLATSSGGGEVRLEFLDDVDRDTAKVDGKFLKFDSSSGKFVGNDATVSNETIQDVVGNMVSSNTESGITVTYQDADGTLDFTIGTLNQDTTGNASTATALETARTINGTSFDGSANITVTAAAGTLTGNTLSSDVTASSLTSVGNSLQIAGSSGVDISQGAISLKNGGTQSRIDFYCESANAHYARLQAPAHSAFSGNVTLTLPATTDTILGRTTTDTLTNKSIDADNNTISNIEVDNLKSGVLDTDISSVSSNDDTLASAKAIKAYVDSQVGGSDLDATTDSGTIDIDLDSDTLTIAGGEGIDTSATGTTITIAGEDASTSNKGVASFSSDDFSVSSGAVTIKSSGVTNAQLAGSIADSKLNTITTANKVGLASLDIDGGTDIGAALTDSDLLIVDDGAGGTNRKVALSRVKTYVEDAAGEVPIANLDIDGGTDIGADLVDADEIIVDDGGGGTNRRSDLTRVKKYIFSALSGDATASDSGALTIANGSVENAMLAGSIANDKLAGSIANSKLSNSSITVTDGSNSTATSLGGTITFSGTNNEVEVSESSGTITIGLPDNVTIAGNLTVSGTTTQTGAVTSNDNFNILSNNNTGNSTDFGLAGKYVESSTTKFAGIFFDASTDNTFRLFTDTQTEPSTTVNISATGYAAANLIVGTLTASGIVIGSADISEAELEILDGATVTTSELNLLDGDTSVGSSITLADNDGIIVNDGGTMKSIPASDVLTYTADEATALAIALG